MNDLKICNLEIAETDYGNYLFDGLHFSVHSHSDNFIDLMRHLKENRVFPPAGLYSNKEYIYAMRMIKSGLWFMAEPFDIKSQHRDSSVVTLSFAPVHECNLRCRYCFAQAGKVFKGEKRNMDAKTLKSAICMLKRSFPVCKAMRLEFVSGGEPLLNADMIKIAVNLAEEIFEQVQIYIVTNGTIYDESLLRFLRNRNVAIGVSIDGNEGVHDANRVFSSGGGTYRSVMQTVTKLFQNKIRTEYGKTVWMVSVVTTNTDSLVTVLKHAFEKGFDALEMRIARGTLENEEFLNRNTILYFKTLYKELTDYIIDCLKEGHEKPLMMITNESDSFGKFIKRLFSKTLTFYRCTAGKSKFALTSTGEFYPCDSFVGMEEYRLCEIDDQKKLIQNNILCKQSIDEIYPCKHCGYRYLCAGDCYYNACKNTGKIDCVDEIHCDMNRYLIGLALHLVFYVEQNHELLYRRVCKMVKYRNLLNPL